MIGQCQADLNDEFFLPELDTRTVYRLGFLSSPDNQSKVRNLLVSAELRRIRVAHVAGAREATPGASKRE